MEMIIQNDYVSRSSGYNDCQFPGTRYKVSKIINNFFNFKTPYCFYKIINFWNVYSPMMKTLNIKCKTMYIHLHPVLLREQNINDIRKQKNRLKNVICKCT